MPQFEENALILNICRDIDKCLSEVRVDKQINLFVHIYSQLDNNLRNDQDLYTFYQNVRKMFFDYKFRQELEFYYALVIDGEEGRLLFDPQITYNQKYDMRNFLSLYDEIAKIQDSIAVHLGIIKRRLLNATVEASGF